MANLAGGVCRAEILGGSWSRSKSWSESSRVSPTSENRGFYLEVERPFVTKGAALRVSQQPVVLIPHQGCAMLRKQGFINHRLGSGTTEICTNIPNPFERSKDFLRADIVRNLDGPFFFLLFKNTRTWRDAASQAGQFAKTILVGTCTDTGSGSNASG